MQNDRCSRHVLAAFSIPEAAGRHRQQGVDSRLRLPIRIEWVATGYVTHRHLPVLVGATQPRNALSWITAGRAGLLARPVVDSPTGVRPACPLLD